MTETTDSSAADLAAATRIGAMRQARMIYRAIFAPPFGRWLIVLLTLLVIAILVTSYGQIILNRWNQPFYDAITRRDLNDFLYQLGVYFAIVSFLLLLDVSQRWLTETIKFRLRESLTRDLLKLWMAPRRAFWLATSGGPLGVNPDQRMSEDANKLCEISTDLSIGLFRSTVLLVSFCRRAVDHLRGLHVPRPRSRLRGAGLHVVGRRFRTRWWARFSATTSAGA